MSATWMKRFTLFGLILMLFAVTACGGSGGERKADPGTASTSKDATATTSEETPKKSAEEEVDPNAKFDPPVTVTTVRAKNTAMTFYPDESIDKNAVYDAYLRDDGIIIKNDWAVDQKEYDEKLKVSIASNKLPDFFQVSVDQLPQLIENDMIMDITELLDKYATEATKKVLTADGGVQMKAATFNGKLMAIPQTNSPFNGAQFVWLRKDWLKEMNLPEPKTMQDFLDISKAFAGRDSGGKGKVFGMKVEPNVMDNIGFFNAYHAYPDQWVKDASGKLVYGSLQPEMKTALKQLQDMYKAGEVDPEFAVNDNNFLLELVANNRIGLIPHQFWYSAELQKSVVKDNKVAQDWGVYLLPSVDDQPAMTQVSAKVWSFFVINKKAEYPEAVIKLLNRWVAILTGGALQEGDPASVYNWGKELKNSGKPFYGINPIIVYLTDVNLQGGQYIPGALTTNDTSKIEWSADLLSRYQSVLDYKKGNTAFWYENMISGEGGSFEGMYEYFKQNRYHYDEFYGSATPTMTERMDLLLSKEREVFTRIMMGSSIDEFDSFAAEWNKLGGDKITQEVNDWYNKNK